MATAILPGRTSPGDDSRLSPTVGRERGWMEVARGAIGCIRTRRGEARARRDAGARRRPEAYCSVTSEGDDGHPRPAGSMHRHASALYQKMRRVQ